MAWSWGVLLEGLVIDVYNFCRGCRLLSLITASSVMLIDRSLLCHVLSTRTYNKFKKISYDLLAFRWGFVGAIEQLV
jgi:hypothetical protein